MQAWRARGLWTDGMRRYWLLFSSDLAPAPVRDSPVMMAGSAMERAIRNARAARSLAVFEKTPPLIARGWAWGRPVLFVSQPGGRVYAHSRRRPLQLANNVLLE